MLPTYLPTFLQDLSFTGLGTRWNPMTTQLGFIHNWVITCFQWMVQWMLSWKIIICVASYKTDGMQVGGDHWCVLIMDTISFQCPSCTPLTSLLYDLHLVWNVYVGCKRMESAVHKVAFRHRRSRSKLWLVFSKCGLLVQYSAFEADL